MAFAVAGLGYGFIPEVQAREHLARGELIPQALVAECQSLVVALKRAFRRMDAHQVKSLCNTTSIEILLADAQGPAERGRAAARAVVVLSLKALSPSITKSPY